MYIFQDSSPLGSNFEAAYQVDIATDQGTNTAYCKTATSSPCTENGAFVCPFF